MKENLVSETREKRQTNLKKIREQQLERAHKRQEQKEAIKKRLETAKMKTDIRELEAIYTRKLQEK